MASDSFGTDIERFLMSMRYDGVLPNGIEILDPYKDPEVKRVIHEMVSRYYTGDHLRIGVWGINPGRFGAGVTGLSFTDPWAVKNVLGIETTLDGRRELSAEFISMVIEAYGGPQVFYRDVYMCALSPLGFIKAGININFYDDPVLIREIVPFVIRSLTAQHAAGLVPDRCIVLGTGKLKTFTEREVKSVMGYETIEYLEHPRFIMQYRRSQVPSFVEKYVDVLRRTVNPF